MKKVAVLTVLFFASFLLAEARKPTYEEAINAMTEIDPNMKQYFPRWRVCEPDLQIKIHQSFVLSGYDKSILDKSTIIVMAAPREFYDPKSPRHQKSVPFNLLSISCGSATMLKPDIDQLLSPGLKNIVNGQNEYRGDVTRLQYDGRDYCYEPLPVEDPLDKGQQEAIIDYFEPSSGDITHAFILSLFDQVMKVGTTGFILHSEMGNDPLGYHYWSSGGSRIKLKKPLIKNRDLSTVQRIPYLLDVDFGGGYRIDGGLHNENSLLSWVPGRTLNNGYGGKIIGGFDFRAPMHPYAGLHLNVELPLNKMDDEGGRGIDASDFGVYPNEFNRAIFASGGPEISDIAPILRSSGQVTLFYNWFLSEDRSDNFVRFDAGLNYYEVFEYAEYYDEEEMRHELTRNDVIGLKDWHPSEFGDWLYLKAEYRNVEDYPFGLSFQYANQILLGDVYFSVFGDFFFIQAKYATPLRGTRIFEQDNFFMISPLLRITL